MEKLVFGSLVTIYGGSTDCLERISNILVFVNKYKLYDTLIVTTQNPQKHRKNWCGGPELPAPLPSWEDRTT
jgi:hypothetical protein